MLLRLPQDDRVLPSRQFSAIRETRCHLTITRSGFVYRGMKLWNLIPNSLRLEKRPNTFKRKVKQWVLDHIWRKPP